MSRPAAGPPSNTSITASAARRTAGPRSTSSWQTCGPIGCKPSCAGVSIVSVETFATWSMLLDDWHSRGIAFVTMGEGIDTSTPAGRLVAGVLGSIAEFERARIQERVRAGLARVRAQGRRLGRKPCAVSDEQFAAVATSLDPARGAAPRRVTHGGRPLAGCKQDLSGSPRGNTRVSGLRPTAVRL